MPCHENEVHEETITQLLNSGLITKQAGAL